MKWANFLHIYQPAEQQPGRPSTSSGLLETRRFQQPLPVFRQGFRHGETPVSPTPSPPAAVRRPSFFISYP